MNNTQTIKRSLVGMIGIAALILLGTTFSFAYAAGDEVDQPVVGTATLSEAEAIRIADVTYKGDGKITEVGLEMEKGVLVYAVEFTEKDGNEVDVKLDAHTGAVVLEESDKTEAVNDDANDARNDDENADQIAKMQELIALLTKMIGLLHARGV